MLISFVLIKTCIKKTYFQIKFELQKQDFRHIFYFLLEQLLEFVLNCSGEYPARGMRAVH